VILTEAEILEMKRAAMPLMVWLSRTCHPHVQAVVDSEQVMIVEGVATASRVERQDLVENPVFTS
jgi:malate/lactate dehydrogenase